MTGRFEAIVIAALSAILAACASGGRSAAGCELRPADSTFAAAGPVYRDCAVERKAELITSNLRPDFTPARARTACYSAEVEFVIDPGGRAEIGTARVLHHNDATFASAIVAMLPLLRYQPALIKGDPVRQIATYKQGLSTMVVAVPAGSAPPSRPSARPPTC